MELDIVVRRTLDTDPDLSWLEQDGFDGAHERRDAYNRGDWCMVGVTVSAEIGNLEIASASLWGIESDSGEDYFTDVAAELKAEVLAQLPAIGDAIARFVANPS